MPVYHQMGHHSENLLAMPDLNAYAGAIVSPVNNKPDEINSQIREMRSCHFSLDILFDPQLYVPRSVRGSLPQWSYFPKDADTAALNSIAWWTQITESLADACKQLEVDGVCSPAPFTRQEFSLDYYAQLVALGNLLRSKLAGTTIRLVQTALVRMADLQSKERVLEIASILSRTKAADIYLNFYADVAPRREIPHGDELRGGMYLIQALHAAGIRVIVGFVSTEIILWKSAGAWACATGKFFNLRRFTPSRWDEAAGGGGQLPYWFEESLLAFFRESDVLRLRQRKVIDESSLSNPFSEKILAVFDNGRLKPDERRWLSLAWGQFMYWFGDIERRLNAGLDAEQLLVRAEGEWLKLDEPANNMLPEEIPNNGSWVRPWRRALLEFRAG